MLRKSRHAPRGKRSRGRVVAIVDKPAQDGACHQQIKEASARLLVELR